MNDPAKFLGLYDACDPARRRSIVEDLVLQLTAARNDLKAALGLSEGESVIKVLEDGWALVRRSGGQVSRIRPTTLREMCLETALGFYADSGNYRTVPPDGDSPIRDDDGEIARRAIGLEERKPA